MADNKGDEWHRGYEAGRASVVGDGLVQLPSREAIADLVAAALFWESTRGRDGGESSWSAYDERGEGLPEIIADNVLRLLSGKGA